MNKQIEMTHLTELLLVVCAVCIVIDGNCVRSGDEVRCVGYWDGLPGIRVIVVNWDGSCILPDEGEVHLQSIDEQVLCPRCMRGIGKAMITLNDRNCFLSEDELDSATTNTGSITTRKSAINTDTASTMTYRLNVADKWSSDATLAVSLLGGTVAVLIISIVYLLRFRRRTVYCCKPATSPLPSRAQSCESIQLFSLTHIPV